MLEVADCNTGGTFIEVKNRSESSYDRSEIEVLQFPSRGDNVYDIEKCDQKKQKVFLPYVICDQNKVKVFLLYVIATSLQSSVAYDPPPTNPMPFISRDG